MKHLLMGAALVAALSLPARADEIARETTALGILSAVDMVTTREVLSHPYTREDNPFARPFVRTDKGAVLYFAANLALSNVVGHLLYRHSKTAARAYMAGAMALEFECNLKNFNNLREQNWKR